MKTPPHIVPEWYFLPFYAILRAVPDKLAGILLMVGAIAVLFILPWLDTSKVRSMRFRPVARRFFYVFLVMCFILGWCGAETPDNLVPYMSFGDNGLTFYRLSQIATIYYFAFFLVVLPVLGLMEKPDERPESITKAVLGNHKGAAAPAE
jgi:ubiquinol-cytochrome c reductase cytochrome b subunit